MRASASLRTPAQNPGPVFARARLKQARIEEEYFLSQELSQNPDERMEKAPSGHIELTLPYDGHKYFTRQAYRDVSRGRQSSSRAEQALVGYLALTSYQNTDLDEMLSLGIRYGSVPILVDLDLGSDPAGHDLLLADSRASSSHTTTCPVPAITSTRWLSASTLTISIPPGYRRRG